MIQAVRSAPCIAGGRIGLTRIVRDRTSGSVRLRSYGLKLPDRKRHVKEKLHEDKDFVTQESVPGRSGMCIASYRSFFLFLGESSSGFRTEGIQR